MTALIALAIFFYLMKVGKPENNTSVFEPDIGLAFCMGLILVFTPPLIVATLIGREIGGFLGFLTWGLLQVMWICRTVKLRDKNKDGKRSNSL